MVRSEKELLKFAQKPRDARQQADDERPTLLAKVLSADTSARLRRIAAWGLAEYADGQVARHALSEAVRRDASTSVREMAAWALAHGDEASDAEDALSAALTGDADPHVRATAAWALGHVGSRNGETALEKALGDTSRAVRLRAVWALGHTHGREAPKPLLALLRDEDPEVRTLAAWALYNIQDPAAVPALADAVRAEKDSDVQMSFIRALAATGEESVDAIRVLLESPNQEVKTMAVRALAGGHATGPWPWPWPDPRPFP
jgi:HEAT repeat protein